MMSGEVSGTIGEDGPLAHEEGRSPRAAGRTAIIGIGCRFPGGANDPDAFWRLIDSGEDPIGPLPEGRFSVDRFVDPHPGTPGRMVTAEGGFLEAIDRFDAAFFGISPREARKIDPQHRLLLEVAWEALEDAGIPPSSLAGKRVGVFVGVWSGEYESVMYRTPTELDFHALTGGGRYAASGRISFALDLRGPSVTLDTACSSSLVALHMARRAIEGGECELAIVGAANLVLQPHVNIGYSRSGMLSAGARCRFGDADAAGYVRSEGVAAVVLKPFETALADRDPVRGVILATGTNADGRESGKLGTPSTVVQAELLADVYGRAGVDPATVPYVEAHGTGTRAGDPVELEAFGRIHGRGRRADQPLMVGSVKSVIGHTEAAAGMAGLIKTLAVLEHRRIPANLHLRTPNDAIDWDGWTIEIPVEPTEWPDGAPLVAGVNSLGITGTNAHVVLAGVDRAGSDPGVAVHEIAAQPEVVALSGRTEKALRAATEDLREWLVTEGDSARLGDVAYTTTVRREHHEHRTALVASSLDDLLDALDDHLGANVNGRAITGAAGVTEPRIGFVFSGQGSQWVGMGRELLATAPVFAETLRRCDEELRRQAGWSVLEVLRDDDPARLERVEVIQPTLTCIQIGLAEQLRAWGVVPEAVVGHSMGEVAAAFCAGGLTLPDVLRVIVARSRLLATIAGRGAMALVDLGAAEVDRLLEGRRDRVSIAALNGPRTTVISGDPAEIHILLEALDDDGVFCRRVKVDVASHSPQTDPLLEPLRRELSSLTPMAPVAAFHSTARPGAPTDLILDAAYWVDNLRRPVGLSAAVQAMVESGIDTFVEIAPHPVLLASLADIAADAGATIRTLAGPRRDESERRDALHLLARLHVAGTPVRWSRVVAADARMVTLPHYPWQGERHWLESWEDWSGESGSSAIPAVAKPEAAESLAYVVEWRAVEGVSGDGATDGASRSLNVSDGEWLIVGGRTGADGLASALKTMIHSAGGAARAVESPDEMPSVIGEIRAGGGRVTGVVVLTADLGGSTGGGTAVSDTGVTGATGGTSSVGDDPLGGAVSGSYSIRDALRQVVGTRAPAANRGDDIANPGQPAPLVAFSVIQALIAAEVTASTWWVTRGTQTLPGRAGSAEAHLEAAVWGLARALWEEHPELDAHLVDLDLDLDADPGPTDDTDGEGALLQAEAASLGNTPVGRAAAEILAAIITHRDEPQLAFAEGIPYVARLRPAPEEATATVAQWRSDGAYLVTGGLGALGLRVADQLASAGVRRVILMGRTPLPPRREWGTLPPGPVAARTEAVLALEARGVAVHLAAVDVGDDRALTSWLSEYRAERWPPIRGIVHCAGALDNRLLREMTAESLNTLLRGKLVAAMNLSRLIPEAERTVYFSSTVPVLPQAGQGNYAAANAGLDALAASRTAAGHPTVSLGWGVWKGEGLVADARVSRYVETMEAAGLASLDPEVASALFSWTAASPAPHLVLAPIDWAAARSRLEGRPGARFYSEILGAESRSTPGETFRAKLADADADTRPPLLLDHLRSLVARILDSDPESLSPVHPLGRQGLDSLMALELRNRLESELELRLPASLAWNYPTLERLTAHLLTRLGPEPDAGSAAQSVETAEREAVPAASLVGADTASEPVATSIASADHDPDGLGDKGHVAEDAMVADPSAPHSPTPDPDRSSPGGKIDARQLVAEVAELSDEEILERLRAEL